MDVPNETDTILMSKMLRANRGRYLDIHVHVYTYILHKVGCKTWHDLAITLEGCFIHIHIFAIALITYSCIATHVPKYTLEHFFCVRERERRWWGRGGGSHLYCKMVALHSKCPVINSRWFPRQPGRHLHTQTSLSCQGWPQTLCLLLYCWWRCHSEHSH